MNTHTHMNIPQPVNALSTSTRTQHSSHFKARKTLKFWINYVPAGFKQIGGTLPPLLHREWYVLEVFARNLCISLMIWSNARVMALHSTREPTNLSLVNLVPPYNLLREKIEMMLFHVVGPSLTTKLQGFSGLPMCQGEWAPMPLCWPLRNLCRTVQLLGTCRVNKAASQDCLMTAEYADA